MSIPQKIINPTISKETLLELLRTGKVSEFNGITKNLENIDLSGADLTGGIILVTVSAYKKTKVEGANFENSILIDSELVAYLRANGAQNVPDAITDKNEIINLLVARGYDLSVIARVKEYLEKWLNT